VLAARDRDWSSAAFVAIVLAAVGSVAATANWGSTAVRLVLVLATVGLLSGAAQWERQSSAPPLRVLLWWAGGTVVVVAVGQLVVSEPVWASPGTVEGS
jgi:hypothetical protein